MNKLKMTCIDVTAMEGFFVVRFQVSSNDPTLYIDGMVGVQIEDAAGFEIGKDYDLKLQAVGPLTK